MIATHGADHAGITVAMTGSNATAREATIAIIAVCLLCRHEEEEISGR